MIFNFSLAKEETNFAHLKIQDCHQSNSDRVHHLHDDRMGMELDDEHEFLEAWGNGHQCRAHRVDLWWLRLGVCQGGNGSAVRS